MTDASSATAQYTFVTVAYRDDRELLLLQARSLEKYLDPRLAAQIIVIENPQPGKPTDWRDALTREYGALAAKVRFVEAREVAEIPEKVSGWFSQQILKLMASAIVPTDRYVVLDGKNHLVHPLKRGFIESPSGRVRSYLMDYETHPMRPFLERTLEYFGLDAREHLHAFMPTTTPFPLPTRWVRELVEHVEAREQRCFPDAFLYDGYRRSEFFLFAAYILSLGKPLSDIYAFSAPKSPAIWPESLPAECLDAIACSEREAQPFFAVHRRVFPKLDDATRGAIARFWCRRGLFESMAAPLRLLSNA